MSLPDFEKDLGELCFKEVLDRGIIGGEKPSVIKLANELEGKVRTSEAFSWYGIAARLNQEGNATHMNVHLLRRDSVPLSPENDIDIKLILDLMTLGFEDDSTTEFGYYVTERPEYTPKAFREELMARYKKVGPEWNMVFECFPNDPVSQ